jgi:hypothetical protein
MNDLVDEQRAMVMAEQYSDRRIMVKKNRTFLGLNHFVKTSSCSYRTAFFKVLEKIANVINLVLTVTIDEQQTHF